ncbi:hypothetical protein [Paraburkholderia caledonica]|jgi:hypothetical protein|uniref:hypothetical protein n=1 Tax=Paraburkholderia caledonica TaxID=134536 RepID=UPI0038BCF661
MGASPALCLGDRPQAGKRAALDDLRGAREHQIDGKPEVLGQIAALANSGERGRDADRFAAAIASSG